MSISLGYGTGEIVSSPSAGNDVKNYAMTTTANSCGAVLLITGAAGSAVGSIDSFSMGGVSFDTSVGIQRLDNTRNAGIYLISDISGRSNDTITVDLVHGATWYNVIVYILEGDTGASEMIDNGNAISDGSVPISLDPGGEPCIAFAVASGGGGGISLLGGQTGIWNNEFFTLYDSAGTYKTFSSADSIGFSSFGYMDIVAAAIIEAPGAPPPDPEYEDPFFPVDPPPVPFC